MVAVKVGDVNFQYENLAFLKVSHSFDALEANFKLVLDVLAKHEDRFVKHETRFADNEKQIAKQGQQIKVLEEKVRSIDVLAEQIKVLQKTSAEHEERIKECEKVAAEFQKVVEKLKEHSANWHKLSNHDFGGNLKEAQLEKPDDELDLFLGHLTFLSVDNSLIRAARPALEFIVSQGNFGQKYTKNVMTLETATRDIVKLQGETEQIQKECEEFKVTFETHATQIGALERGVKEVDEKADREVARIDEEIKEASEKHQDLVKTVGVLEGDLHQLDQEAARSEELKQMGEVVTDVQDDVEKIQLVVNSYSQTKDQLREELLDKMDALQKKIEVSMNEVKMKGGGGRGGSGKREPGETVRDVVHVQDNAGTDQLRKKIESHTTELETLFDLYNEINESVGTKLDRKDLSSKTDVSHCEQLLLNIADSVDKQMESITLESPAMAELKETLKRLQDAVDGRVDVIGGGRVSRRNSQVAAENSVSRVPESYTQKPTIVRVRTASGRNSPAVGKGVSNSNLQIVKTRMTGQAAGSDGVMYNGIVTGGGRAAHVTPLQEGPRPDLRERPRTAGVWGGKGLSRGSIVAPTKVWDMDPSIPPGPARSRPQSSMGGMPSARGSDLGEWDKDENMMPPSFPMHGAGGFRPKSAQGLTGMGAGPGADNASVGADGSAERLPSISQQL